MEAPPAPTTQPASTPPSASTPQKPRGQRRNRPPRLRGESSGQASETSTQSQPTTPAPRTPQKHQKQPRKPKNSVLSPVGSAPAPVAPQTAPLTLGAAAAVHLAASSVSTPPHQPHPDRDRPAPHSAPAATTTRPPRSQQHNRARGAAASGAPNGRSNGTHASPTAASSSEPASSSPAPTTPSTNGAARGGRGGGGGGGGGRGGRGSRTPSAAASPATPLSATPKQVKSSAPGGGPKQQRTSLRGTPSDKNRKKDRRRASPPRIPLEVVQEGLKSGKYVQGQLRVNPSTQKCEAYVVVSGFERDILVSGKKDRLKALDGDIVAVELDDRSKWKVIESRFNKARELTHKAAPAAPTVASFVEKELKEAAKEYIKREIAIGELQDKVAVAKAQQAKEAAEEEAEESEDTTDAEDDPPAEIELDDDDESTSCDTEKKPSEKLRVLPGEAPSHPYRLLANNEDGDGECSPQFESPSSDEDTAQDTSEMPEKVPDDEQRVLALLDNPDAVEQMLRGALQGAPTDAILRSAAKVSAPKASATPAPAAQPTSPVVEPAAAASSAVPKPVTDPTAAPQNLTVALRPTGHIVAVIENQHQEIYVGTLRSSRAPANPKGGKKKSKDGAKNGRGDAKNSSNGSTPSAPEKEKDSGASFDITVTDRFAVFVPLDKKCPKMLVRLPRLFGDASATAMLADMNDPSILWVAQMLHWREHYPHANLLRKLGDCTSLAVQHEYLLINSSIDWTEDFSPQVLACVPKASEWRIPESEYRSRRDIRADCVFSIDPPTAKDLDDALSITLLPNGHYQVGVHIADVSYFVKPRTAIDDCAKMRATTVYLVHKSIPMLPRFLSENACSLNPAEDRLAFSVIWELDAQGNKHSEWFGRTVIRSCCKLNYDLVHQMLETGTTDADIAAAAYTKVINDGKMIDPTSKHILSDVVKRVHELNSIAKNLRKKRFDGGALRLGSSKLVFQLDPSTGIPCEWGIYEQKDSNFLVEEFMLLANFSVAQKIHTSFPNGGALLRRHPPPLESKLIEYLDLCKQLGVELDASSAGALQKSFERLQATVDPDKYAIIQYLATKPMQPAKYTHTDPTLAQSYYHHYALSVDTYTHFTSPIRRYADIIVHRLLNAALTKTEMIVHPVDEVKAIATNCNRRKQSADKAQEECDYLYLCQYLLHNPPLILEGIVIDLRAEKSWVIILVPSLDLEEMLMLKDVRAQEQWNADETELSLTWPPVKSAASDEPSIIPEVKLRLLSRVQVQIAVNTSRRPMELRLQLVVGGKSIDELLPRKAK